jgi:hypothetical protein
LPKPKSPQLRTK